MSFPPPGQQVAHSLLPHHSIPCLMETALKTWRVLKLSSQHTDNISDSSKYANKYKHFETNEEFLIITAINAITNIHFWFS